MSRHFTELENKIKIQLQQKSSPRLSLAPYGYTGLYASLDKKRNIVKYELRYKKPLDKKLTTRTYKGKGLEEVATIDFPKDRLYLSKGIDPNAQDRTNRAEAIEALNQQRSKAILFKTVYAEWEHNKITELTQKQGKTPREARREPDRIRKHIYPHLADTPVGKITSFDLIKILTPLFKDSYDTAKKCYTALIEIFAQFEIKTNGKFKSPITTSLTIALRKSREEGIRKTGHFSAPAYWQLPMIFHTLGDYDYLSSDIVRFCILTACRLKAARLLRWSDITFDDHKGYFVIPESNNKVKGAPKESRTVYFGNLVYLLLLAQKESFLLNTGRDDGYVFPKNMEADKHDQPIGEDAVSAFMKKTFHYSELKKGRLWKGKEPEEGLIQLHATSRSCFQTWALEQIDNKTNLPKYRKEVIEHCLLHSKKDAYKGAYDRSSIPSEEIYQLKNDWENFCSSYTTYGDLLWERFKYKVKVNSGDEQEALNMLCELEEDARNGVESEETKSLQCYNLGQQAIIKAQQDFKKFGGEKYLKDLEHRNSKQISES